MTVNRNAGIEDEKSTMQLMEILGVAVLGVLVIGTTLSQIACQNAIWADYENSMEDEKRAPDNLEAALEAPASITTLVITGQWIRHHTLEAHLVDGRRVCLARRFEDISDTMARLKAVGVDISKIEPIWAKLAARRAARS